MQGPRTTRPARPPSPPPRRPRLTPEERAAARRRRTRRRRMVIGAAALAVVALVVGIVVGASGSSAEQRLAERFGAAWEREDYAAMHRLISEEDRSSVPRARFAAAYTDAADVATATGVEVGEPGEPEDGQVTLPVTVQTRVWGPVRGTVVLPIEGEGDAARVDWSSALVFPGLRRGERLARDTELPARGAILARDGTPLAEGPDRSSSLSEASNIVGELGAPPAALKPRLAALGYPDGAIVGISGLERIFEERVAGKPGGELLAGRRVLARSRPRKARPVRSTISPRAQRAAVAALGDRLGGVAALDPDTGEILGLAGIAFSTLQPPGSTMKVITVTAALEERQVTARSKWPVVTSANVGGQTISNAGGESCGGDLRDVFAHSCNSAFGPMGVELGAEKLVDAAERFGFNEPTGIPGAEPSQIPEADDMTGDADVGSSAIGQGRVLSTALGMASVAQTIANNGVRLRPIIRMGDKAKRERVTSRRIADRVEQLMVAVVNEGTGTNAAIRGARVAGKTGTAELGGGLTDDAWFVAFAPARRPKMAVGVLVVQAGSGGDIAAPIAKQFLEATL